MTISGNSELIRVGISVWAATIWPVKSIRKGKCPFHPYWIIKGLHRTWFLISCRVKELTSGYFLERVNGQRKREWAKVWTHCSLHPLRHSSGLAGQKECKLQLKGCSKLLLFFPYSSPSKARKDHESSWVCKSKFSLLFQQHGCIPTFRARQNRHHLALR